MDFKRRKHERAIASEIANELNRVLGRAMPEALADNRDIVCGIFATVFDRHHVVTEDAGARILSFIPGVLACLHQPFARPDLDRKLDAAMPNATSRGQR